MGISEGLRTSLNAIRETLVQNNTLYSEQIVEIMPDTDINAFGSPLLSNPDLMNAFIKVLVQRIVYTQIETKIFNNPLKFLEGEKLPLGSIGQEIFINPAKGRKFNINDFAGLLAKYESDIKVQYPVLDVDNQYPATITRAKLKNAFTSWGELESLINGITQSLYNGAYIDRYRYTKALVSSAYSGNNVQIQVVDSLTTEEKAKQFLTKAREIYLNMQEPSSDYNAWNKVGGYGKAIITWTEPQDIVFLIRNDIGAYLDVNVLSQAFNLDKAQLLGRVKYVNNFNVYDENDNIVYDGSKILGIMCDKSWFRIKNQETTMEDFYNVNNRTYQLYLNDVNMFKYSLFANSVVFATELPEVKVTSMKFEKSTSTIEIDESENIKLELNPVNTTDTITFTSSDSTVASVEKISNKEVKITGESDGTATITATSGNVTTTITITVPADSSEE